MVPDDPVLTADLGEVDAYLIEAHSFGGISGSPVFARETISIDIFRQGTKGEEPDDRRNLHGLGAHYLVGLIHGHWHVHPDDINAQELHGPQGAPGINLGIAIVIPAGKIIETLNTPMLRSLREDGENRIAKQRAVPKPDSRVIQPSATERGEPERLQIEGKWEDAVTEALQKQPPEGG